MSLEKFKNFKSKLDKLDSTKSKVVEKYGQLIEETYEFYNNNSSKECEDFLKILIKQHNKLVNDISNQKLEEDFFKNAKIVKEKKKMIKQRYLNDLYDYKISKNDKNISKEELKEKKKDLRKSRSKVITSKAFKVSSVLISIAGICLGGIISSYCSALFCGVPIIANKASAAIKSGIRAASSGGKKIINGMSDNLANSLKACLSHKKANMISASKVG